MFIYVKKATINLVSTYNNKRRKIKVKFNVNESTLAWKLDLLISTFLTTFRTLENFTRSLQVYKFTRSKLTRMLFVGILDTNYEVCVSQNSFLDHIYYLSSCVLLMKYVLLLETSLLLKKKLFI